MEDMDGELDELDEESSDEVRGTSETLPRHFRDTSLEEESSDEVRDTSEDTSETPQSLRVASVGCRPLSPHVSPCLPMSPRISPSLPIPP